MRFYPHSHGAYAMILTNEEKQYNSIPTYMGLTKITIKERFDNPFYPHIHGAYKNWYSDHFCIFIFYPHIHGAY